MRLVCGRRWDAQWVRQRVDVCGAFSCWVQGAPFNDAEQMRYAPHLDAREELRNVLQVARVIPSALYPRARRFACSARRRSRLCAGVAGSGRSHARCAEACACRNPSDLEPTRCMSSPSSKSMPNSMQQAQCSKRRATPHQLQLAAEPCQADFINGSSALRAHGGQQWFIDLAPAGPASRHAGGARADAVRARHGPLQSWISRMRANLHRTAR
jgi:hypothetical protein